MIFKTSILLTALTASGCVTTDGNGKPIAHEVRTAQSMRDAALAEATLDGSRVVASGHPPLAFLYPGTGRLSVRDIDAGSIVFTVELPDRPENQAKTLISVGIDGKLTGSVGRPDGTTRATDIALVNKSHEFVITYLPGTITQR